MEKEYIYPDVLNKSDEMYKNAKRISHDSAIFGDRKALLEKHFSEHPIYLDDSYYAEQSPATSSAQGRRLCRSSKPYGLEETIIVARLPLLFAV